MSKTDIPLLLLTATVWAYWLGVAIMIARVRRQTKRSVGVVPEQRIERLMWVVWVPLIALWLALPYVAQTSRHPWLAVPAFTLEAGYMVLRYVAAACAIVCLAATVTCWVRMGADWRMAVSDSRKSALITDGLFKRIRHPIYAFSILLMISSAVIVATPLMLIVALVHIVLMNLKARNEEVHLLRTHGTAYERYLRETGRFVPRLFSRGS